jgi:uroporphyrinogen-III synthase
MAVKKKIAKRATKAAVSSPKKTKAKPGKKSVKKSPAKSIKKVAAKAPAEKSKKIKSKKAVPAVRKTTKAISVKKVAPKPAVSLPVENSVGSKKIRKSLKKPLITIAPPPKIDVSNFPKNKVKNILVSQPQPVDTEKNPYYLLARKHNLNIDFRQFIRVEGLSAQDFRAQRIDILEHGAVILTSKLSVDHYFKMCNEMRVTVPESMKYFCINEQTAYYLQKYIQYRKRKIFFGHGTMLDLVDVIRKNKDEKFLLPVSDVHKEQIVEFLDELKINYTKGVFYKTVSADLSDIKSLNDFDVLVFFTPAGIRSLKANFPNFKQGSTRIAAFGHTAALTVKELGYRLDIFAPNPQNPSMSGALDVYIKEANKR